MFIPKSVIQNKVSVRKSKDIVRFFNHHIYCDTFRELRFFPGFFCYCFLWLCGLRKWYFGWVICKMAVWFFLVSQLVCDKAGFTAWVSLVVHKWAWYYLLWEIGNMRSLGRHQKCSMYWNVPDYSVPWQIISCFVQLSNVLLKR